MKILGMFISKSDLFFPKVMVTEADNHIVARTKFTLALLESNYELNDPGAKYELAYTSSFEDIEIL
jgi:hypothetical protein